MVEVVGGVLDDVRDRAVTTSLVNGGLLDVSKMMMMTMGTSQRLAGVLGW